MEELKERMLALLDETAQHYNSINRCVDEDGLCVYVPTPDGAVSEGCAIGRKFDGCHKAYILRNLDENSGSVDDISDILNPPKALEGLPLNFLQDLQLLHDGSDYWTEDGLSMGGLSCYTNIRSKIINYEYFPYPTWDRDKNRRC